MSQDHNITEAQGTLSAPIRAEFASFPLTPAALKQIDEVRRDFSSLLTSIEMRLPAGRERALVLTHLQTAKDWAIRGIAVQPENQAQP